MTTTRHVPPAPPAVTRLAVAAALAAFVAACGAGLDGAAAGPGAGVGVLAALALAVPAGWWLAPRVPPGWGRETDRPGQAEARALAVRLCGDARGVRVGAVVGWAVLHAAPGLAESGGALVRADLAALGGAAGVAVVAAAGRTWRVRPRVGCGIAPPRTGAACCASPGGPAGGVLSGAGANSGRADEWPVRQLCAACTYVKSRIVRRHRPS